MIESSPEIDFKKLLTSLGSPSFATTSVNVLKMGKTLAYFT